MQRADCHTKLISTFTACIWAKTAEFSFALPSNDLTHDKFVVNAATEKILNELKLSLPNLNSVVVFLDGAASQFKQKKPNLFLKRQKTATTTQEKKLQIEKTSKKYRKEPSHEGGVFVPGWINAST
ncbi:unnamed protein product [Didymodactylos carnosus]|uniref:Uncharacterized protein n=1 Tax=Didymodactylos carnosus TaxID=1234261 RepID=A0A814ME53_9BILA|nr:unnamed protein product [Didymodactylos carnosus]CAF1285148.1 unnamed protein product [Didymodactylos carnosus]CAF3843540.1 unnamed protein product [Didymodactylos carnosus]CAF4090116.1 unnamed protein product [Didymodactylos carnosus]